MACLGTTQLPGRDVLRKSRRIKLDPEDGEKPEALATKLHAPAAAMRTSVAAAAASLVDCIL